jgi:hypothetical protein
MPMGFASSAAGKRSKIKSRIKIRNWIKSRIKITSRIAASES